MQERRSLWHFCANLRAICRLSRACIRAKHPQAARNADSSSRVGQPGICRSTGPYSRLSDFCWLVSSLPDSYLLTDLLLTALSCWLISSAPFSWLLLLFSGTFHSLTPPVSWEISRTSPLCGFRAKTDKGILWLAPTPTETNVNHRVTEMWCVYALSIVKLYLCLLIKQLVVTITILMIKFCDEFYDEF